MCILEAVTAQVQVRGSSTFGRELKKLVRVQYSGSRYMYLVVLC